ncbi:hypothetical protein GCM10027594_20890 [Hymenobacter agri]
MRYADHRHSLFTRPSRLAALVPRFGLLLSLICSLLLAASSPALATHYRYGSLTWQTVASDPTGRTIKFKVSQAFREDFPWPGGPPSVGDTENTGSLLFGDSGGAPINLVITSVNLVDNSFYGEVEITHTYASTGSFTASFTGGNRLSPPLQNNADQSWYVSTDVTTGTTNNSPISTLPAVVNLAVGQPAATFTVPGSDAQPLTYSLVSSGSLPVPFTNAPGLSITPAGVATFSTVGKTVSNFYNAIVRISDGSTSIMVDFLIRIVGASASPVFDYGPTPANNSTIQVVAGHPVSFGVQAHDPDAGDVVSLAGSGLPLGSAFALPTPANPVSSTFSWTPGVADVGPHVLSFTAQDPVGVQAITAVTLDVILCNLSLSASSTDVRCNGGRDGAIDLTISGGTAPLSIAWTGPGGFAASTEDLSGLSAGTYTVVVTDANNCSETTQVTLSEPAPLPAPTITPTATSTVYTGGPVTTIFLGYGPQSVSLTASGVTGTYTWSPAAGLNSTSGATVTASPTATTTYTVTGTTAAGCTASASITIALVDVRCGNKNDKVLVCHNGHEICIAPSAVPAHLTTPSHSDVLGACPAAARAGLNAPQSEPISLEAYPNPAGDQATVLFRSMQPTTVAVEVYNYLGARVATLFAGEAQAGQQYALPLNSRGLANGLYYCRLAANGAVKTTTLMITR